MATTTMTTQDLSRSSIPEKSIKKPLDLTLEPAPISSAYRLLHIGFTIAPILAGADKFLNVMTDWEDYLAPEVVEWSGYSPREVMQVVGGIEIAAGLLVAAKPKIGGYVVAGWLAGIIGNLALRGNAWDIALRDFGLMLGALALGRMAPRFEKR
jgi:hypothetical protein